MHVEPFVETQQLHERQRGERVGGDTLQQRREFLTRGHAHVERVAELRPGSRQRMAGERERRTRELLQGLARRARRLRRRLGSPRVQVDDQDTLAAERGEGLEGRGGLEPLDGLAERVQRRVAWAAYDAPSASSART